LKNLMRLIQELEQDKYLDVTGNIQATTQDGETKSGKEKFSGEVEGKISLNPSLRANLFSE